MFDISLVHEILFQINKALERVEIRFEPVKR